MSTYYLGDYDAQALLGAGNARYYYALRRTDQGDLYFTRVDQLLETDEIIINAPGDVNEDYSEFEVGVDYFDGRDETHERPFLNLYPDQYRWDSRSIYYYINDNGELVARINRSRNYPTDV